MSIHKALSRGHLLEPVFNRILREGFARTTLEEFAETANIAPATFHVFFESKDQLLNAVVDELQDRMITRFMWLLSDTRRDPLFRLRQLQRDIPALLSNPMPAFIGDLQRLRPDLVEKLMQCRRARLRSLSSLITEGITQKKINASVDPQVTVDILIAMVDNIVVPEYVLKRGLSIESLLARVFQIFLDGLGVPCEGENAGAEFSFSAAVPA